MERVREAFNAEEVVRLDCTHVGTSDCKKIGVKLRVYIVLLFNFLVAMTLSISIVLPGLVCLIRNFVYAGFSTLCPYLVQG